MTRPLPPALVPLITEAGRCLIADLLQEDAANRAELQRRVRALPPDLQAALGFAPEVTP